MSYSFNKPMHCATNTRQEKRHALSALSSAGARKMYVKNAANPARPKIGNACVAVPVHGTHAAPHRRYPFAHTPHTAPAYPGAHASAAERFPGRHEDRSGHAKSSSAAGLDRHHPARASRRSPPGHSPPKGHDLHATPSKL